MFIVFSNSECRNRRFYDRSNFSWIHRNMRKSDGSYVFQTFVISISIFTTFSLKSHFRFPSNHLFKIQIYKKSIREVDFPIRFDYTKYFKKSLENAQTERKIFKNYKSTSVTKSLSRRLKSFLFSLFSFPPKKTIHPNKTKNLTDSRKGQYEQFSSNRTKKIREENFKIYQF